MSNRIGWMLLALICGFGLPGLASDNPQPVRMGAGIMTFDTVPGWGLGPDGKSQIGSTHGGVVVDEDGNIYTSAHAGIYVFTPNGKLTRSYLGKDYADIHDLKIRVEADGEFLYGARNNNAEGIKIDARTGSIVLRLPYPEESKLNLKQFKPTAIAVAPNGDIFLSDGYSSNHIFKFDKTGKYLTYFGSKGNGLQEFNTAHGMALDTRYTPPRLLICDRNHEPRGRLVHYDLDGQFLGEVTTGLNMPTSAAIQGDYVSVPDLQGRLIILDKITQLLLSSAPTSTPYSVATSTYPKKIGSRGFSAVRMVPLGIRTAISMCRIGTRLAGS